MVAAITYHLSVITALISNGTTVDPLTQDVIVDILTAGGFSKMQIREALTGPFATFAWEKLSIIGVFGGDLRLYPYARQGPLFTPCIAVV
jgi:hypothetical protein